MALYHNGSRAVSIASVVIYGQEVLYAARGQDARSRPAQAGIQEGEGAVVNWWPVLPNGALGGSPLRSA